MSALALSLPGTGLKCSFGRTIIINIVRSRSLKFALHVPSNLGGLAIQKGYQ